MLLVHYNDLKADLEAEIGRIARFLEFKLESELLARIVEAASFETMRAQGDVLLPTMAQSWDHGARRFLYKGTNDRWRDVVSEADLSDYAELVKANFSPGLAAWLEHGRLVAGDPATSAD
jgi:aryl sulfotransferase